LFTAFGSDGFIAILRVRKSSRRHSREQKQKTNINDNRRPRGVSPSLLDLYLDRLRTSCTTTVPPRSAFVTRVIYEAHTSAATIGERESQNRTLCDWMGSAVPSWKTVKRRPRWTTTRRLGVPFAKTRSMAFQRFRRHGKCRVRRADSGPQPEGGKVGQSVKEQTKI